MQLQNRLLVPENPFRIVAELADVLCIEKEVPVLGRLPGPGAEQLIDDALVGPLVTPLHHDKRFNLLASKAMDEISRVWVSGLRVQSNNVTDGAGLWEFRDETFSPHRLRE